VRRKANGERKRDASRALEWNQGRSKAVSSDGEDTIEVIGEAPAVPRSKRTDVSSHPKERVVVTKVKAHFRVPRAWHQNEQHLIRAQHLGNLIQHSNKPKRICFRAFV
jgi:hypothetical protein